MLFSGFTVIVALCGMLIMPMSVFQSLGIGAILVVVVAVFATLTLIPAMLSLLGDRINWPRRRAALRPMPDAGGRRVGFWGVVTRMVMAAPLLFMLLAGGGLVALASPLFSMHTGETGIDAFPKSDVKDAYEILLADFYAGADTPIRIVIDGKTSDAAVAAGIANLQTLLAQRSGLGTASVETNPAGDLTVISVPTTADPASDGAMAEVKAIRTLAPAAFDHSGAAVYVGGNTAETIGSGALLDRYNPLIVAFVLGFSFLLLMVAVRSLVVPITAIAMNLRSVGSAYGLLVLVFQRGYGADVLGLQRSPVIEGWIPLFLFCVLFGLSMDYHVFLLSRIREHYDRTGRNAESVAAGLQSTAKIITGAATIMVVVFGAFAAGRIVSMQQMGFGLAAAVLIDATVIRSLLVPATMRLLGDRNWLLPRRLHWLPDVRIDGAAPSPAASPAA